MIVKTLSTLFFCILVNKVFFTKGENIVEIGYGPKNEYTNWENRPPSNYTMIFYRQKLPKGILIGFSGYAIRSSLVYFQVWRERAGGFELISEYKRNIKVDEANTPVRLTFLINDMPESKCKRIIEGDYFGIHIPGSKAAFPLFFEKDHVSIFEENVGRELNVVQNISKFYFPYGMSASAYIDTDDSRYGTNNQNGELDCLSNVEIPSEKTTITPPITQTPKSGPVDSPVSDDGGLETKYLILIIVLAALLLIAILLAIFCFFKKKNQAVTEDYDRFKDYSAYCKSSSPSQINYVTSDDIYNQTMSTNHSYT